MPLGALASTRSHEVEALALDRARYGSRFELSGRLAPVVETLLGGRLRAGFAAMTTARFARAVALHPTRSA